MAVLGAAVGSVARASVFRVSNVPKDRPIAPGFVGLGLEYRSIPILTGPDPQAIDPVLVQLIRNLSAPDRPVLRIGGQSTDRTWWPVRGIRPPLGITYNLTPTWLSSARALAVATQARLVLGVGLEANQPRLDAVEAQQLLRGLGRQYIDELEIGNEPELYPVVPWYRTLHGAPIPWYSHVGVPIFARSPGYNPTAFFGEFSRVLRALPAVPIAGPATGVLPWLDGFHRFLAPASRVRLVSWHAYGLNQCVTDPSSPHYPSVANLLAPPASRGILNGISPFVAQAHQVGASFRVDEMNSVTCNGRRGVSDTFASALWAMDALFTIADYGVDGVNIHTYQNAANGLFDFSRSHGRWQGAVHPLYYGLMMFAQAAPPGSRLLRIAAGNQNGVRVWATLAPDHRVRVLLINDNLTGSARELVRGPAAPGPAAIERLRAPSAYAKDGITLGGESFGAHTQTGLLPLPLAQSVTPHGGGYPVVLPAASAALLTIASKG